MGKDWVYSMSSGEGNTNSSRKRSRKRSSSSSSSGALDRNNHNNSTSTSTVPSGCMNAVFQLFHLNHYFNFSFNSTPTTPHHHHLPPLQGVVAPRNSLEVGQDTSNMEPSSLSVKNPQSLQLPMGGIQIKTRVSTDQDLSSSSESAYISGSPAGTKTPTLVARLMGLDLLPETPSPRPSASSPRPSASSSSNLSASKSHLLQRKNKRSLLRSNTIDANTGTRSLPDTPRTSSSSSARRSDVDQRFSLQINKENSPELGHEFEFSKFLTAKIAAAERQRDENMSRGHYAKQIVKQFKESVSRRVGRDITNTVDNRSEQRRDQHVVLLKSKKPTPSHDHKDSTSPKHRLMETTNKSITSTHSPKLSHSPLCPFVDNQCESVEVPSRVKVQGVAVVEEKQIQQNSVCKKVSNDQKYSSRLYMMPQTSDLIRTTKQESFVKSSAPSRPKSRHVNIPDKKCKKSTPLSNVANILTVKKDPSPPATRLPHQQEGQRQQHKPSQSQMKKSSRNGPPSCLSQLSMYKQKGSKNTVPHLVTQCTNSNAATGEVYQYISKILNCTGIEELTAVSITNWYSPSHPLDPSIFHHLKLSETSTLGQCRLVFDVADEILAGILKPYLNLKPWSSHSWNGKSHVCLEQPLSGGQLINTLCGRIRSFPSADCRVLEDIDGLIDTDLSKSWESYTYEEESGNGIVGDVEGDIFDGLMHETLLDIICVSVP